MATDVAAPFPAVELLPLSTLTVTVDQAGAKITLMNVHGYQADTGDVGTVSNIIPPILDPAFFAGEPA